MYKNKNIGEQLRRFFPTFVITHIFAVFLLGGLFVMHWLFDVNLYYVMGDPHSVFSTMLAAAIRDILETSLGDTNSFRLPLYVGLISNLGILLWCSVAAICFFTYLLLSRKPKLFRIYPSFFFWSAVISSILLFDDLFLIHEKIVPKYLGISQNIVFMIYGLLILTYFLRWRRQILRTEYIFLLLALVFFALSLFLDIVHLPINHHTFFEDSFKFMGILNWSAYYIQTCRTQINILISKIAVSII